MLGLLCKIMWEFFFLLFFFLFLQKKNELLVLWLEFDKICAINVRQVLINLVVKTSPSLF